MTSLDGLQVLLIKNMTTIKDKKYQCDKHCTKNVRHQRRVDFKLIIYFYAHSNHLTRFNMQIFFIWTTTYDLYKSMYDAYSIPVQLLYN